MLLVGILQDFQALTASFHTFLRLKLRSFKLQACLFSLFLSPSEAPPRDNERFRIAKSCLTSGQLELSPTDVRSLGAIALQPMQLLQRSRRHLASGPSYALQIPFYAEVVAIEQQLEQPDA